MSKATKAKAPTTVKVRLDRRVVLAVILVPLILLGLWFFFTAPARADAEAAKKAQKDAVDRVQAVQVQIKGLETGQTPRSQALLRQAYTLDTLMPAVNDPIALGTSLTSYAASTGVQIASFSKGEAYPVGKSTAQAYQVVATGSREQLSTFLDGVSKYPQLLTVPTVTVGTGGTTAAASSSSSAASSAQPAAGALTATFTLLSWSSSIPVLNVTVPVESGGSSSSSGGGVNTAAQRPGVPTE